MTPLPEAVSDLLRTSSAAATAAAFIIASAHGDLLFWVASMTAAPEPPRRPRKKRKKAKANGREAHDPYLDRRRAQRDRDDDALLAAMKAAPEESIYNWATTIGKSKSSVVTALRRLRDADLAESDGGKWKLTEEPVPREPPPRWIKPPSAVREHATA